MRTLVRIVSAALLVSAVVGLSAAASAAEEPPGRYLEEVFGEVEITPGLAYGAAPNQEGQVEELLLDLYQPKGDTLGRRPAIVWVHGGGFIGGDRSGEADNATSFAKRGYVTVSISYRLGGGNVGQAITNAQHDAQAAVRWLRRYADQYGIDPDRIAIGGTSAGAITALFVGNHAEDPGASGNPGYRSDVGAAVSISGFGGHYSPGDAPAVLFHGTADPLLPYALAVGTCDEYHRNGNVCELHAYDGAGHGLYPDHQEEIQSLIAEFLVRHLNLAPADGPPPGTELARTGSGTVPLTATGAGLVVAGVGAVLLARHTAGRNRVRQA